MQQSTPLARPRRRTALVRLAALLLPLLIVGLRLHAARAHEAPDVQPTGTQPTGAQPVAVTAPSLPAGFALSNFISGLHYPTDMLFLPNGDMLIAEKGSFDAQGQPFANVLLVRSGIVQPTPVARLAVSAERDSGLFGLVLDPNFAANGWFYVWHATSPSSPNAPPDPVNRVARLTFNPATGTADPASYRVVLDNVGWSRYHNGGGLHFLPDGTLLVSTGDANESELSPQLGSLNGKLLRIRPTASGSPAYTVPSDNPFVGVNGARSEVYALGLRNPWRIVSRESGGDVVVGDVGLNMWEEIDAVRYGANYGWPEREGPCPARQAPPCSAAPAHYTPPLAWYQHMGAEAGGAVTGLAWYEGAAFPPDYQGALFFSDYDQELLGVVKPGALGNIAFFASGTGRVVDLEYFRGALYLLDVINGTVKRLDYSPTQNVAPTAVLTTSVQMGPPPLAVTLSAAASSDPDDPTLRYIWELGDGSMPPADTVHTFNHTFAAGTWTVKLTVRDTRGARSSTVEQTITAYAGELPSIVLTLRGAGGRSLYHGGDMVDFAAMRSTTADLDLTTPWSWRVELHHNDHVHPELIDLPGATGAYDILTDNHGGETDVHLRFVLTMHTAQGQPVSVYRDLFPELTHFGVDMLPRAPGWVYVDGALVHTPAAVPAIVGTTFALAPEAELVVGRSVVGFAGWQGATAAAGAPLTATQTITAGLPPLTHTMLYAAVRDAELSALPLVRR